MPRSGSIVPFNDFTRGLITEAIELNQPAKSTVAEDNCVLLNKGVRRRRRGVEFENEYVLNQLPYNQQEFQSKATSSFTWKAAGGNGNINFAVVQFGNTLYFHEINSNTLSATQKPFTVNLDDYAAPTFSDTSDEQCVMDSGKGALFVVSPKIDPFYIEYDVDTDTIEVSSINIQKRDFDDVEDGVEVDEETLTLSPEQHYNLLNRGWHPTPNGDDPLQDYKNDTTRYPAKNFQWFTYRKDSGGSRPVDGAEAKRRVSVNESAPQGHYIVDAFNIDRSTVSGIAGIASEVTQSRPTTVAFFAGRAWYAGVQGNGNNSNIFYSQILTSLDKAGKCYQSADPVGEEDPALVATDGGVISINDIGVVYALVPLQSFLIVIASNGVWSITGPDGNFKADDFSISKVGDEGAVSGTSVVRGATIPIWWGETGIFTVGQDADSVTPAVQLQNLTEQTIQTFYDDIPKEAKRKATAAYDAINRRVVWFYKVDSNPALNDYHNTKALWLDLKLGGAFYPWTIEELSTDTPYIVSALPTPTLARSLFEEEVVDNTGETVTDNALDDVTANVPSIIPIASTLKFLTVATDGQNNTFYTFSEFTSKTFTDWANAEQDEPGTNFNSYAVTWWELNDNITNWTQAPYIYVYSEQTESGYIQLEDGSYGLVDESGLFLTPYWDFAGSPTSRKVGRTIQVYKLKKHLVVDPFNLSVDAEQSIVMTRSKIRGRGRALQLRFDSEEGKDFAIYGWAVVFQGNTGV